MTLGNTGPIDGQMEADCETFASGGSNTVKSNGNNNFFLHIFCSYYGFIDSTAEEDDRKQGERERE